MYTLSKESELGLAELVNLNFLVHVEGFKLLLTADVSCYFVLHPLVHFVVLKLLVFFNEFQSLEGCNLFSYSMIFCGWESTKLLGVLSLEQSSLKWAFSMLLLELPPEEVFTLLPVLSNVVRREIDMMVLTHDGEDPRRRLIGLQLDQGVFSFGFGA